MDFHRKKVLIIGTGISGIAAARLLDQETEVILYDANEALSEQSIRDKLPKEFRGQIVLGEMSDELKKKTDIAVLSPSVPTDIPDVMELRAAGVQIIGEIELAYQFSKGRIAAITGTNGKTTTTALTGEIMKTFFHSVFVVGNIGIPYTQMAEKMQEDSVTVAELSSFQLETVIDFHPYVSAILNITPDHLNRHHTMQNYIDAKLAVTVNQTAEDYCILNYEDEILRKAGETMTPKVIWFSSLRELPEGLFVREGRIIYRTEGRETVVCAVNEMNIIGRHNHENAMAAIAAGIAFGVPMESIHQALTAFVAVEHRIEYVTEKKGVKYYNDSKGTNPDAAIQAIRAMSARTLLIGGGYDKGSEYDEWIDAFEGKVKYLVLMGQTRDKIAETARKKGFRDIVMVESMEEAVKFCASHAGPGETVLLSPCCASWGMFQNYEERGRIFKECVRELED